MNLDTPVSELPQLAHVIVDPNSLQSETLTRLATEFVLREQANDSISDSDLDASVARALLQIKNRTILITFDPDTESVGVIHSANPALKSK